MKKETIPFEIENELNWETALTSLFPKSLPLSARWRSPESIVDVLNCIAEQNLNHTFHPRSGGLDLTGAKLSREKGCIELNFEGLTTIVKPKELQFESFGKIDEWCYFRLELDDLAPSGAYEEKRGDGIDEYVTELPDGTYVDGSAIEYGEYEGRPTPKGSRGVERLFKGTYVTFRKTSFYNTNDYFDAYVDCHRTMGAEDFRHHIGEWRNKIER